MYFDLRTHNRYRDNPISPVNDKDKTSITCKKDGYSSIMTLAELQSFFHNYETKVIIARLSNPVIFTRSGSARQKIADSICNMAMHA